jgi:predicted ATP-grasp superfamily ATP-dependent carboligase
MRLFIYESLSAGGLGSNPSPSLRAEGRAMLTAAAADFARVADVSTLLIDSAPTISGIGCMRTTYAEEPRRFLDAIDDSDAVLIIAPEFDDILADRAVRVVERGKRLLGCSPDAIRLTSDKLALARYWNRRSLLTPPTSLTSEVPTPSFPAVVKPRRGAGSLATRLVDDRASWPAHFAAATRDFPGQEFIVQPYRPGRSCSVAFLVGSVQTLALAATEQILSDDGRFQYRGGRLPLDDEGAKRSVAIASAALAGLAGLVGYVGVDLILGDDGKDWAIEINPRLTTSYVGLRALCRHNLAEAWLRLLDGESGVELSWRPGSIEFFADGRVNGSSMPSATSLSDTPRSPPVDRGYG